MSYFVLMNMSTLTNFTNEQWAFIEPHLPKPAKTGRPGANDRQTLEAILWIDRTGARWQDLPKEYGEDSTANRRLRHWQELGVFQIIWQAGLQALDEQGKLDLTQSNLDATFAPAKGSWAGVGNTRKGKGTKIEIVSEGHSIPLSVTVASANEAEITLAEPTVKSIRIPKRRGRPQTRPELVCADKAYDSMAFRRALRKRGIKTAIPERTSKKQKRRKKGPKPKCEKANYEQRWKVERTFAWFGNFRRMLIRWEREFEAFKGFVIFTCMFVTIRNVVT